MKTTILQRINETATSLKYMDLYSIIALIRSGDMELYDREMGKYTIKEAVEYIRKAPENEKQSLKFRLLPAVAYNATFTKVNRSGIKQYSCFTALDFDHIETTEQMESVRSTLMHAQCVICVFVTPSGKGLKAIVWHDNTNPEFHQDLYEQLLDKFNITCSDKACKDLARRNYLSYDPDIWINPLPIPYHYYPRMLPNLALQSKSNNGRKISDKSIISIMNSVWREKYPEYWEEGKRANSIFKLACQMCKWGVDEDLATQYFIDGWENDTMSETEIIHHVGNAYKAEADNFNTLEFRMY